MNFLPKTCWICFLFKGDSRNDIMVNLEVLKGFNPPCLFRLGRLRVKAAVFRHHPKGFTRFPWDFISCKCFKNPERSWRCLGSHRIIYRISRFHNSHLSLSKSIVEITSPGNIAKKYIIYIVIIDAFPIMIGSM